MRVICFISALIFMCSLHAQKDIQQIQDEIDQQVWRPFKKAFENLDGVALNSIYAEEVLRVTPNGIDTDNDFKSKNLARFKVNKAEGITIALDFWFDSRRTNLHTSYEVGFYRIGFTSKEGGTKFSYGQFHIVIKKIGGIWKIMQDWDTPVINGDPITESDFAKKEPLKFQLDDKQ